MSKLLTAVVEEKADTLNLFFNEWICPWILLILFCSFFRSTSQQYAITIPLFFIVYPLWYIKVKYNKKKILIALKNPFRDKDSFFIGED